MGRGLRLGTRFDACGMVPNSSLPLLIVPPVPSVESFLAELPANSSKIRFMEIIILLYYGMARRRNTNTDAFLNDMISLPWWGSVVMGSLCWIAALLVLAWFPEKHPIQAFRSLWWLIPGVFGVTALRSLINAGRARISLGQSRTLRDLQMVPWDKFEELSASFYRARGYSVVHTGKAGPDGGFDLVLRKDGERMLVQCKKYVREPVGVRMLREFYGVVVSEGAHRGIFITTGDFTPDAREFGLRHANLELIPGRRFAEMVLHLNSNRGTASYEGEVCPPATQQQQAVPACPNCNRDMIQRTAKSGRNAGDTFWGCPGFPSCRGTRPMAREMIGRSKDGMCRWSPNKVN